MPVGILTTPKLPNENPSIAAGVCILVCGGSGSAEQRIRRNTSPDGFAAEASAPPLKIAQYRTVKGVALVGIN